MLKTPLQVLNLHIQKKDQESQEIDSFLKNKSTERAKDGLSYKKRAF